MKRNFMFTSESVTEGHPDKLCDQISDAIVDRFLQQDPFARVITECAIASSILFISARFESDVVIDFNQVARGVIDQVGYNQADFNSKTSSIVTSLKDIESNSYRHSDEQKLTDEEIEQIPVMDQVTVFGFACNQTPMLMPLPIWLAHQLARRLTVVRSKNLLPSLSPDAKTQVGVEYRDRKPYRIHSISLITCQQPGINLRQIDLKQLAEEVRAEVIDQVFEYESIQPDQETRIFIDTNSSFTVGGPTIHSGLTGRKTGIDTYGEYARHSGSALSGKDPSRIDRIGAYAARYAAVNLVAAGLADECEVQLSYSVGLSRPVSVQVETFGTGKLSDEGLTSLIQEHFDFRLAGIIRQFNLRHLPSIFGGCFYQSLSAYGHFGRPDLDDLPWERTDKVTLLKEQVR